MGDPRQAYANARLQARHAALPQAIALDALTASRSLERYLEVLRGAPGLRLPERAREPDAFEAALREHWRATCREIARWHPVRWRAAYDWCARLVDLPALEFLRAEPVPLAWMRVDAGVATIAAVARDERAAALEPAGLAAMAGAWREGRPLLEAWHERWEQLCPAGGTRTRSLLARLVRTLAASEGLAVAARRDAVENRCERLFRQSAGTPVAGFVQLALQALMLERVRGGYAARLASAPGAAA